MNPNNDFSKETAQISVVMEDENPGVHIGDYKANPGLLDTSALYKACEEEVDKRVKEVQERGEYAPKIKKL
jgi:hypothetical protein